MKKETILSISIAVASLMVIILFSGKFIYKYDAEWNKVLSSHITGFDIVSGATKEYLSGENYISFVLEPNMYARLIMFALVFIIGIMFIPNNYFKIKTVLSSFMLTISFVFSFLMKSTLLENVNNITGLSFSAFYPMNLVIVVLGILAVLNLILTIVYLLKSKKSN